MNSTSSTGASGQFMVDQRPSFDKKFKKRRRSNGNQVISRKTGIIRPDKRKKPHYF